MSLRRKPDPEPEPSAPAYVYPPGGQPVPDDGRPWNEGEWARQQRTQVVMRAEEPFPTALSALSDAELEVIATADERTTEELMALGQRRMDEFRRAAAHWSRTADRAMATQDAVDLLEFATACMTCGAGVERDQAAERLMGQPFREHPACRAARQGEESLAMTALAVAVLGLPDDVIITDLTGFVLACDAPGADPRSPGSPSPWSHIPTGLRDAILTRRAERLSPKLAPWNPQGGCGICGMHLTPDWCEDLDPDECGGWAICRRCRPIWDRGGRQWGAPELMDAAFWDACGLDPARLTGGWWGDFGFRVRSNIELADYDRTRRYGWIPPEELERTRDFLLRRNPQWSPDPAVRDRYRALLRDELDRQRQSAMEAQEQARRLPTFGLAAR